VVWLKAASVEIVSLLLLFSIENKVCHWRDRFGLLHLLGLHPDYLDLLAYATLHLLLSRYSAYLYPPVWNSVAVLGGSTYEATHEL
jgi:hypothetical protein